MKKIILFIVLLPLLAFAQPAGIKLLHKKSNDYPTNFEQLVQSPTFTLAANYDKSDATSVIIDGSNLVSIWMDKSQNMALGTDLLAGWNFTSGWSTVGLGDAALPNAFTTAGNGGVHKTLVTIGNVYKCTITGTTTASSVSLTHPTPSAYYATFNAGAFNSTFTFVAQNSTEFYLRNGGAGTTTITSFSLVRISGNHIFQSTSTAKPLYQPAWDKGILFDGTSDFLKTAAIAGWTQPMTIYFVGKQVSWTASDYLLDGYTPNATALYQRTSSPNIAISSSNGVSTVENAAAALGQVKIFSAVYNGTSSSFAINDLTVPGSVGTAVNPSGITVGGASGGVQFSNIEVFQILIYLGVPSAAQDTYIRNALYQKFGGIITR